MSRRILYALLSVAVLLPLVYTLRVPRQGLAQEPVIRAAPTRPASLAPTQPGTGFVPPRVDLSHLTGGRMPEGLRVQALTSTWDWRTQGKVTPVKDQGPCGACYAFASIANIESRLLIDGAGTYDFSENNAKECNWYELTGSPPGEPWGSCDGGNYDMMASLFSKKGTVLDSCDPYVSWDAACKDTCAYQTTLLDWRIISGPSVPNSEVLKSYIQTEGPVYTSMYVWPGSEFYDYDGYYTLYYDGPYPEPPEAPTNHAVLIVGWDDTLHHAGGMGGWIVKNSWGTGWGASGYFTIAYGSANIGMYSSFVYDWQAYDADGDVLYYDEGGSSNAWGCGTTTAWGLAKFIPARNTEVTRVEFWTSDATTDVDVYLYDGFDGTAPSDPLAQELNNFFDEAGYHSVVLGSPLSVTAGDDIIVVVKLTNDSFGFPVVADLYGPYETGRTYISCSGSSGPWTDLGASYGDDVAIRLRTSESGYKVYLPLLTRRWPPIPGIPVLNPINNPDGDGDYTVSWGTAYLADTYTLQEDDNAAFSSPTVRYAGSGTSSVASGQATGTYYYRVLARNSWGDSGWSNSEWVIVQGAQWITIVGEDFEGSFPGSVWEVGDFNSDSGHYYWGKRDCRDHGGDYSAWCVGAGDSTVSCGSNYRNDMRSWMVYGPFSLVGASGAELTFDWRSDTQYDYDWFFWGASTDGTDFYGTAASGGWSTWTAGQLFDFSAVPTLGNLLGEDQVWMAFAFLSDSSVTDGGSFVDNVLLRKRVGGGAASTGGQRAPATQHVLQPNQTLRFANLRLDR